MNTRMFARRVLMSMGLATLVSHAAHAQELQLFSWSGRVDREVRLTVRGAQLSNTTEQSISQRGGGFRNMSGLPERDGIVRIVKEGGRGDVSVMQQPTANNGYTAIIRIADTEGGADMYRVSAYWTPLNDPRLSRGNRGVTDERRSEAYSVNAAPSATMLRWSGDVDGEVQLAWRGGSVSQRLINGDVVRGARTNITGDPINNRPGAISVTVREGRGQVEVLQQPNASNRYTCVIRIVDPQSGYGHYSIEAIWQ
jgi:hypothetical protein